MLTFTKSDLFRSRNVHIEFQNCSIDPNFFSDKLSTCILWEKYERGNCEALWSPKSKPEKKLQPISETRLPPRWSARFIKGNFRRKFPFINLVRIFEMLRFPKIYENFQNIFLDRSKKYFRKSRGKNLTSRSKQNLLADRMEALPASEKHSPRL